MTKPTRPTRQVCPLCGIDDEVTLRSDGPDLWTFTCGAEADRHPYEWVPTGQQQPEPGRVGLAEELGVYDTLLRCVHPGERVEYGIVEYRFAEADSPTYRQLVERYGHHEGRPSPYTASSFLAHALGQLAREGLLGLSRTKATGYWSYLDGVSAWSLPESAEQPMVSWADYAARHGIVDTPWPKVAELW